MNALLAAATNDPAGGTGGIALFGRFDLPAVAWAIGFTVIWDAVDLWIRYGSFRFFRTLPFWLYLLFHFGLSTLAVPVAFRAVPMAWLAGLLAATANEMLLSNTNITFGQANLLPILEMFRRLRAAMQTRLDAMQRAEHNLLVSKVRALPAKFLQNEVVQLLVGVGDDPGAITQKLTALNTACAGFPGLLEAKLAHDLIQLNRDYVVQNVDTWLKTNPVPAPPGPPAGP